MRAGDPDEWTPWWPMDWHTGPAPVADTLVGQSGPESTLCDAPPVTLPRARHAGFTADLTESA